LAFPAAINLSELAYFSSASSTEGIDEAQPQLICALRTKELILLRDNSVAASAVIVPDKLLNIFNATSCRLYQLHAEAIIKPRIPKTINYFKSNKLLSSGPNHPRCTAANLAKYAAFLPSYFAISCELMCPSTHPTFALPLCLK
jgi:hypothetical protein